jgi:hypothetical protein
MTTGYATDFIRFFCRNSPATVLYSSLFRPSTIAAEIVGDAACIPNNTKDIHAFVNRDCTITNNNGSKNAIRMNNINFLLFVIVNYSNPHPLKDFLSLL